MEYTNQLCSSSNWSGPGGHKLHLLINDHTLQRPIGLPGKTPMTQRHPLLKTICMLWNSASEWLKRGQEVTTALSMRKPRYASVLDAWRTIWQSWRDTTRCSWAQRWGKLWIRTMRKVSAGWSGWITKMVRNMWGRAAAVAGGQHH